MKTIVLTETVKFLLKNFDIKTINLVIQNMNNNDFLGGLSMLKQLGINPSTLTTDKLERLNKLGMLVNKPEDITSEITREISDILGISMEATHQEKQEPKISMRHGRNKPCLCGSEKKYKKCCLK